MSLNIVDSLLDKLSLVSKDKNIPFGKKFTGSQNFLGTNYISQSIPTEFFMDGEYLSLSRNKMIRSSSLDSKMNIFHYFDPTNDRLVSRVSKLLSPPMLSSQDPFRVVPNYLEILRDQELFLKQGFKLLCEEVEQQYEKLNKRRDSKVHTGKDSSQIQTCSVESPCMKASEVNLNQTSIKNRHQTNSNCVENISNQSNKPDSMVNTGKDSSQIQTSSVESPCKQPSKVNINQTSIISSQSNELNSQSKSLKDTHSQSSLLSSVKSSINPNKVLNSQLLSNNDTCHRANLNSSDKNASIMMQDVTVSPVVTVVLKDDKKLLTNNSHTMNEKLTNRKNKEMQKRSKKRRRRQKKHTNTGLDKDCATKAGSGILKNTTKANASSASPNSSDSGSKSSDILCDIMTIAENASGVQILLPNASSFVISIESAEDDSDWDSNSDCEWLNDCSEFEFSGIFISNLSAPLTSTLSQGVCFSSQLSVPSSPTDEVEMHRLGAVLRRVNNNWIKAMKGLDTKPRVATKVLHN